MRKKEILPLRRKRLHPRNWVENCRWHNPSRWSDRDSHIALDHSAMKCGTSRERETKEEPLRRRSAPNCSLHTRRCLQNSVTTPGLTTWLDLPSKMRPHCPPPPGHLFHWRWPPSTMTTLCQFRDEVPTSWRRREDSTWVRGCRWRRTRQRQRQVAGAGLEWRHAPGHRSSRPGHRGPASYFVVWSLGVCSQRRVVRACVLRSTRWWVTAGTQTYDRAHLQPAEPCRLRGHVLPTDGVPQLLIPPLSASSPLGTCHQLIHAVKKLIN